MVCFSVTKLCRTLCNLMVCSMPTSSIIHYLSGFAKSHAHCISNANEPSCPLPQTLLLPSIFPCSFPMCWLLHQVAEVLELQCFQCICVSNEYSGLICFRIDRCYLQWTFKSFSTSQFESLSSSVLSLLYGPTLTSIQNYWKKQNFDCMNICWQSDVSTFLLFNMLSRFLITFFPRSKCF